MGFSAGAALAVDLGATAGGVAATTAGIAGAAALGAGVGATASAIEGGDPGQGALFGGITGGFGGAGGAIGGALGGSTGGIIGGIAGAAGGGALGADLTGRNPLTGAIEGGAAAGLADAIGSSFSSASPTAGASGGPAPPGASAGGGAPPAGLIGGAADATSAVGDITSTPLAPPGFDVSPTSAAELNSANPAATALAQSGTVSGQPDVANVLSGGGGGNVGGGSAAAPGTAQTILSQLGQGNIGGAAGTAGTALLNNPSALIAGGGLLYNTLQNNNAPNLNSNLGTLTGQEGTVFNEANSLAQGNLPPTIQTAIGNQLQGQIAQIKSYYAGLGMSGSSSELAAIQQAQNNAQAQAAQYVTTGLQVAGASPQTLSNVLNINQSQQQQTGQAIANLAAALGGVTSNRKTPTENA